MYIIYGVSKTPLHCQLVYLYTNKTSTLLFSLIHHPSLVVQGLFSAKMSKRDRACKRQHSFIHKMEQNREHRFVNEGRNYLRDVEFETELGSVVVVENWPERVFLQRLTYLPCHHTNLHIFKSQTNLRYQNH